MKNMNNNSLPESEESLKNIIADTLQLAKKNGATQAEAGLTVSEGMSVSARMRSVETVEYQKDNGLGISVYFGKHKGTASTSSLDLESIRKTVEAACNIAKYTSEDPCTGLADAELMATEFTDLDMYHEWNISSDEAIEMALADQNWPEIVARGNQLASSLDKVGATLSNWVPNFFNAE